MSYGPAPWQQRAWDWRAAANFIAGGAGAGLIVFAACSRALGGSAAAPFACGAVLVAVGLLCVWLEIGRPMRALHVFFNPRSSWMSREAFVATLLLPSAIAAAFGVAGFAAVAALLALAFVWCQARILKAAKGIPAWRAPRVVGLIVATALAEGGGLFLLSTPAHGGAALPLLVVAGLAVLARFGCWLAYRRQVGASAARPALAALDGAARWLQWAGTLAPLLLIALATTLAIGAGTANDAASVGAAALAGVCALGAGAGLKLTLVTRAAFNQGFALARLPVRGTRRTG
jgi:phenylacetyl-CoA:acceptor oxidoreductase subunit 2